MIGRGPWIIRRDGYGKFSDVQFNFLFRFYNRERTIDLRKLTLITTRDYKSFSVLALVVGAVYCELAAFSLQLYNERCSYIVKGACREQYGI